MTERRAGVPSLLWCPKPHPAPQPQPYREKGKTPKESRAGKHLFRDVGGHPESHQLTGLPQPGTATRKEMKSQRLSLWCSAEHKNPALKQKQGRGRQAEQQGGEWQGCTAPKTRGGGAPHTNTHLHGSRVSQKNKCKVCYKSLSARKSERA